MTESPFHSPRLILSGFADEATRLKDPDRQFSVMAALGLKYVVVRFVDCGHGPRNVIDLSPRELATVRESLAEYGLQVSSIGSPLGKIRIADIDDGTSNRYVPFADYLENDVVRAIDAACQLESRLIRGFSFYPPRGAAARDWLPLSVDHLGRIADRCRQAGVTFGLEVEANLIGHTGEVLAEIFHQVNSQALVLVFDGGNLVTQGHSRESVLRQFRSMLPGLGWMHIKDSRRVMPGSADGYVDEAGLCEFVPADIGDVGHEAILQELAGAMPEIAARLRRRGIADFFIELEPHLRAGGQFGGFSGPDGMGVALRALCEVLDRVKLDYEIRRWPLDSTGAVR
jgi:sugar phosphate isomerase/epimerase